MRAKKQHAEAKETNVQVILRCRPLNKREREKNVEEAIACAEDRKEVIVSHSKVKNPSLAIQKTKTFNFDHVFGPNSTQYNLYKESISPIVEEVLKGFNCTIFAYGQTGTGKTYTMEGKNEKGAYWNGIECGVIPRAIRHVFESLQKSKAEYTVRVSFLELYNEELFDLLASESLEGDAKEMKPLRIFDSDKGITVAPLEEVFVNDAQDIFTVLEKSAHKRRTAETLLNHNSRYASPLSPSLWPHSYTNWRLFKISRSHCIFSITIHIREVGVGDGGAATELVKVGKLNLVDLAGSENISRSGALNQRKREACLINQSLLTLGRVITALTDHLGHVPYRESKLTRLLQDSLGGLFY